MATSALSETIWDNRAQQDRSRKTQGRILLATERLLEKRPFRDISILDITRKARASTSSFYQRFGDKTGLLGSLFERHAKAQIKLLDELLDPKRWKSISFAQFVREVAPVLLGIYRTNQGLVRAFIEQAATDERFHQTWSTLGTYTNERIKDVVRSHLEEITHPDPMAGIEQALDLVYGNIIYEIMMHQIDGPKMEAKTDYLIRLMLTYMGVRDAATSASTNEGTDGRAR